MGPAALTASKQTTGDLSMCDLKMRVDKEGMMTQPDLNDVCERFCGGYQESVILVPLRCQDMLPLEERPLLGSYLENCEFSNCLCNIVARVHCCCSSTHKDFCPSLWPQRTVFVLCYRHLNVGAYGLSQHIFCHSSIMHQSLVIFFLNFCFNYPSLTSKSYILPVTSRHMYIPTKSFE